MFSNDNNIFSVLLVEDNDIHADLIRRYLAGIGEHRVKLVHAQKLSDAIAALKQVSVDAILLDLSLPDSQIEETLPSVLKHRGDIPIIVLTSLNDLEFGARAVQQGAQDYLVKTELSTELLLRAIRYAIERKKTQEKLESYAADLERSNEHLKNFAHTVAHEVKSPLGVVAACLQMLDDRHGVQFDTSAKEMMQDASSSIRGLSDLVNELLDFARVGSEDQEFVTVDMEAVFYQVLALLRPSIRATQTRLTHDPLPPVRGNEVQLKQLLQNLIGNAIKYRGTARPEIHVAARDESPHCVFSVRDNGLGVPEDWHSEIFEAFVRLHNPAEIPGTGIGLAFCKRIVEHHGGRIWVESSPGEGSNFLFTLAKP